MENLIRRQIIVIGTIIFMVFATGCDNQDKKVTTLRDSSSFLSDYNNHRVSKNFFFQQDPSSPLLEEDRAVFKTLNYFVPDLAYKFTGAIYEYPKQEKIKMLTSTSELREFYRFGYFVFTVDTVKTKVNVYKPAELRDGFEPYYFIPFKDLTNGEETYEAGRYLEIPLTNSNIITLDFNLAYNPYCAYNVSYSCPLPPEENSLNVAIRAGEKSYKPEENPNS